MPDRYVFEGAYTFESGLVCGKKLLAMTPRPTAAFAGNDEMAAGIYWAARDAGLEIPRDLSVVGYDDNPMSLRPLFLRRIGGLRDRHLISDLFVADQVSLDYSHNERFVIGGAAQALREGDAESNGRAAVKFAKALKNN